MPVSVGGITERVDEREGLEEVGEDLMDCRGLEVAGWECGNVGLVNTFSCLAAAVTR